MYRPKILVYLIGDFSRSDGGMLWAESLLENLARVREMDFVLVTCEHESARAANSTFAGSLGFKHIFLALRTSSIASCNRTFPAVSDFINISVKALREKYYYVFEEDAYKQSQVDGEFAKVVHDEQPDLIVVNHLYSTLYTPSLFSLGKPYCLIMLHDEVAFQCVHRSHGGRVGDKLHRRLERWISAHANWIANRRMRQYVSRVCRSCSGIVFLTHHDIPPDLPCNVTRAVIPPVLKQSDRFWTYHGTRSMLFVGNMHVGDYVHFGNKLAIEWICTQFAPELLILDNTVRVDIIGAQLSQVPSAWRIPNVNFIGSSSKDEVNSLMTTTDFFIAPIVHTFGAKLKLAQCVSWAMPFLASTGAMSGLPFLKCIPLLDLQQPRASAQLAVKYINSPEALVRLSQEIAGQVTQAREAQDAAWRSFLKCSLERCRPSSPT